MFNSKLTKIAATVALAASATAMADVQDQSAQLDDTYTVAYQLTKGENHELAILDSVPQVTLPQASNTNGLLRIDFTNGAISPRELGTADVITQSGVVGLYLSTTAAVGTGTNFGAFDWSTDDNGNITSVTFAIGQQSKSTDFFLLTSDDDGGDDDVTSGTIAALDDTVIVLNSDLSDGDVFSIGGAILNSDGSEKASLTSGDFATLDDGLTFDNTTTGITVANDSVAFAFGGEEFDDGAGGSQTTSTATLPADLLAIAALDEPLTVSGTVDGFEITLSTTGACDEVTEAVGSVTIGGADADSVDGCSYVLSDDVYANIDGALVINVNGDEIITTKDWTISAKFTDVNENEWALASDVQTHAWTADVQGDSATVPYMYHNNTSGVWSQATFSNTSDSAIKIAAEVTYVLEAKADDRSYANAAMTEKNYYIGEIPANGLLQVSGTDVLNALINASGDSLEGYNTTSVDVDMSQNYHMSVKFTFDGDSSTAESAADAVPNPGAVKVEVINKNGQARSQVPVYFGDEQ